MNRVLLLIISKKMRDPADPIGDNGSQDGFLSQAMPWLVPLAVAGLGAASKGGPKRQWKYNKKAADYSNELNRKNQEWTLEQNKRIQQEQRMYDSASAQMQRYKDAGLNPHLIYGSGGGAGGAFSIAAGQPAGVNMQAPSAQYPDVASSFLQAGQTAAQIGLTQQKTIESEMNTALKSIMIDIQKTNPMLKPDVAHWMATMTEETARLKALESRQWMNHTMSDTGELSNYAKKINADVEALAQRLGLNTADLAVKNKILESKEFENAVKEVNANWLKNGVMSPEHIRMGGMLLLQKLLGSYLK